MKQGHPPSRPLIAPRNVLASALHHLILPILLLLALLAVTVAQAQITTTGAPPTRDPNAPLVLGVIWSRDININSPKERRTITLMSTSYYLKWSTSGCRRVGAVQLEATRTNLGGFNERKKVLFTRQSVSCKNNINMTITLQFDPFFKVSPGGDTIIITLANSVAIGGALPFTQTLSFRIEETLPIVSGVSSKVGLSAYFFGSIASVVGGLFGHPYLATILPRGVFLYTLSVCSFQLQYSVDFTQYWAQTALGTSPYKYFIGAAALNSVLILLVVMVHLLFALWKARSVHAKKEEEETRDKNSSFFGSLLGSFSRSFAGVTGSFVRRWNEETADQKENDTQSDMTEEKRPEQEQKAEEDEKKEETDSQKAEGDKQEEEQLSVKEDVDEDGKSAAVDGESRKEDGSEQSEEKEKQANAEEDGEKEEGAENGQLDEKVQTDEDEEAKKKKAADEEAAANREKAEAKEAAQRKKEEAQKRRADAFARIKKALCGSTVPAPAFFLVFLFVQACTRSVFVVVWHSDSIYARVLTGLLLLPWITCFLIAMVLLLPRFPMIWDPQTHKRQTPDEHFLQGKGRWSFDPPPREEKKEAAGEGGVGEGKQQDDERRGNIVVPAPATLRKRRFSGYSSQGEEDEKSSSLLVDGGDNEFSSAKGDGEAKKKERKGEEQQEDAAVAATATTTAVGSSFSSRQLPFLNRVWSPPATVDPQATVSHDPLSFANPDVYHRHFGPLFDCFRHQRHWFGFFELLVSVCYGLLSSVRTENAECAPIAIGAFVVGGAYLLLMVTLRPYRRPVDNACFIVGAVVMAVAPIFQYFFHTTRHTWLEIVATLMVVVWLMFSVFRFFLVLYDLYRKWAGSGHGERSDRSNMPPDVRFLPMVKGRHNNKKTDDVGKRRKRGGRNERQKDDDDEGEPDEAAAASGRSEEQEEGGPAQMYNDDVSDDSASVAASQTSSVVIHADPRRARRCDASGSEFYNPLLHIREGEWKRQQGGGSQQHQQQGDHSLTDRREMIDVRFGKPTRAHNQVPVPSDSDDDDECRITRLRQWARKKKKEYHRRKEEETEVVLLEKLLLTMEKQQQQQQSVAEQRRNRTTLAEEDDEGERRSASPNGYQRTTLARGPPSSPPSRFGRLAGLWRNKPDEPVVKHAACEGDVDVRKRKQHHVTEIDLDEL